MSSLSVIKTYTEDIFKNRRFAVLATEGDGQPHASLIAVTPMEGFRKLIFATYRNTRKYSNLVHNGNVAILVENINIKSSGLQESIVLTAFGHVEEIKDGEEDIVLEAHLERHPELSDFLKSGDCSLVRIKVHAYQFVRGIDDVEWWTIDDLGI
jgi:heme iron utilization protein